MLLPTVVCSHGCPSYAHALVMDALVRQELILAVVAKCSKYSLTLGDLTPSKASMLVFQ